ncbi:CvpA family protein [Methylocystis bryophila]|uniref:Colicin V synthesis protein n=1 Tax=Methylocystis bryophila TaxID=655015 RepID=A0A1W6MT18_9HYPH|nr:CvpA family protein [Methylocystis bryophila]ARN80639.1 colicin V synthesis protein [Methylocystis bryophila]BDV40703.1 colicin V biosynthesis protein [Methylocystis bryophila]
MPSYLDLAVLGIVLFSALLATLRGFTREVLAIVAWAGAAAVAYIEFKSPHFLGFIKPYISKEVVAQAVDAAAVFFVALFLITIVTVKLSDVILDSKIGALDRTLGFVFGAARGFLIAVVLFIFYGWLVPENNQPSWVKTARGKPVLEAMGDSLRDMVPQDAEAFINELKNKKSIPAMEEPPPEPEGENAKQDEPSSPPQQPASHKTR